MRSEVLEQDLPGDGQRREVLVDLAFGQSRTIMGAQGEVGHVEPVATSWLVGEGKDVGRDGRRGELVEGPRDPRQDRIYAGWAGAAAHPTPLHGRWFRAMLRTFAEGTHMTEHDHHHEHHHELSYADAVRLYRADKDAYFRTGHGSPVPPAERASFPGIPYFPVDETFIAEGLVLEPYDGDDPVRFEIPTTDGHLRPAERVGVFGFALRGRQQRLTAFRLASAAGEPLETLFVPFLDETSGTETYGAGRYLDLEPDDDGTWTLDFNLAYQPSCVYDPRYSCPLTPPENRLGLRIEAGERLASVAAPD